MNNYKLGSLFDGSGGFPLAGALCGIEPVWAAEVEPYPIAVTRSRFPKMKHLGDISKVNGAEIEPVDIITFGSPCQDLSVAGKRAGLKHTENGDEETTRSGLFMEAVRIIKEMRNATNGQYPTFALWENVPGAFSSNAGEDFKVVLEELIKIVEPSAVMPDVPQKGWNYADSFIGDGWSLAYRVLDAQYWGVPQRRRRIYLVADFRAQRAREILFEREGLRGYFTQGRTPWKAAPADAQGSTGADDKEGERADGSGGRQLDAMSYGVVTKGNGDAFLSKERHTALTVGGGQAGQGYPAAMVPYTLKIRSGCEGGGKGALIQKDKSATLATNNDQYLFQPTSAVTYDARGNGDGSTSSTITGDHENRITDYTSVVVEPAIPIHDQATRFSGKRGSKMDGKGNGLGIGREGDPMNTLTNGDRHAIAYGIDHVITTGGNCTAQGPCVYEDIQATLKASGPHAVAYITSSDGEIAGTLDASYYKGPGVRMGRERTFVAFGIDPGAARDVGDLFIEEQSKTLTNGSCPGHHNGVVIADNTPAVCYSQQAYDEFMENEVSCTLKARGGTYGGGSETLISEKQTRNYIVRRLTPTECARLQGFADRWGDIDAMDRMSAKDYQFWKEARNTHDVVIKGKDPKDLKDYTVKQMVAWYNKLQTDSAEYKMWGNGIAFPTALYVIQGIADALSRTRYDGYNTEVLICDEIENDDSWMS